MDEIENYIKSKLGSVVDRAECEKWTLELARLGLGLVSPNPMVGCVIVDEKHKLISWGYHKFFGSDHAEIDALKKIKNNSDLNNATLYVNLEPCSHIGKTPSCATALTQLPIKSVIYGMKDPNPLVSGQGIKRLESKKINCEVFRSLTKKQLEIFNSSFCFFQKHKKCEISLKIASSLDGAVALKTGESQWITNIKSREKAHQLRFNYDAMLVGRKTIEQDNPKLDIRLEKTKENSVIVLDSELKLASNLNSFNIAKVRPLNKIFLIADRKNQNTKKSTSSQFNIIFVDKKNDVFDLEQLRVELLKYNIGKVLVEGGAITTSSFIEQNQFNKMYLFLGNSVLGTKSSKTWSGFLENNNLNECLKLKLVELNHFGDDVLLEYNSCN